MENRDHTVVVFGASNKPERYSNMAIRLLKELGYRVIPVHPMLEEIDGIRVMHSLDEVIDKVQTLTLYVGRLRSEAFVDEILALNPGRVIFNPGSESELLEKCLEEKQIPFIKGCTLVMLQSRQF